MAEPVSEDDVLVEGYLDKRSPHSVFGIRPWQQRYFLLTEQALVYYESCEKRQKSIHESKGILSLPHVSSISKHDEDIDGRCFDLRITGDDRVFELRAADSTDCERWVLCWCVN